VLDGNEENGSCGSNCLLEVRKRFANFVVNKGATFSDASM